MWCDNFDMDLRRVLPDLEEILGDTREIALMTRGRPWQGKLNHPSCWNTDRGLAAYFMLWESHDVNLSGPQPPGFVTSDHPVICTFEEALRDCWCHQYLMDLQTDAVRQKYVTLWDSRRLWPHFQTLMSFIRRWQPLPDEAELRTASDAVRQSLKAAAERLRRARGAKNL